MISTNATAQSVLPGPFDVVKVFQPELRRLVDEAYQRSPTVRGLVEELRPSGWLVFLQDGVCPVKTALGCLIPFVGTFEGSRYMRAIVNRGSRHRDAVMTTVAHELQHAVEVARAPEVADAEGIRILFQRIGRPGTPSYFSTTYDTAAARAVEAQVWRELSAREK